MKANVPSKLPCASAWERWSPDPAWPVPALHLDEDCLSPVRAQRQLRMTGTIHSLRALSNPRTWQDSPMSQDKNLTVDDLIRECGDLRWVYVLRNHETLKTASGQPLNEAKVFARGREFMARDADPARALNAAMNGLARTLELER